MTPRHEDYAFWRCQNVIFQTDVTDLACFACVWRDIAGCEWDQRPEFTLSQPIQSQPADAQRIQFVTVRTRQRIWGIALGACCVTESIESI